jgi:hypothetical protein
MFAGREFYWKGKLLSNGNHATRDVGARDGAGVPGICKQKNGFGGNPIRIALISQNLETLIQVTV